MNEVNQLTTSTQFEIFKNRIFPHIELDDAAITTLGNITNQRTYRRKSYLLSAGERWNKLFYIYQGLIRLFYLDIEGREFNKAFFAEGQTIWPVAPYDRNQGVLFNIAAVEATTVLECPFPDLYDVLQEAGQWEKFALPFAEKLVEQKFQREHDFLLLSATERLKKFSETYPHLIHRLPDYHLASFLGITNVSLSRIKRLSNSQKVIESDI